MAERDSRFALHQARTRPRKLGENEVSLSRTNIVISEELAAAHFQGVQRVVFLFDANRRILGIRPVYEGERGYKLSARSLSAKSFYEHFNITDRGRFPARFEGGVLQIALEGHVF